MISGEDKPMPVPCIMLGLIRWAFAVYGARPLGRTMQSRQCICCSANEYAGLQPQHQRGAPKYTNHEEGMAASLHRANQHSSTSRDLDA